jgi:CHAD domain-containing protein
VNVEREAKLQAPPGFVLPDLNADGFLATIHDPQRVLAVYHDTEDLALVRWGCSLRHREGEGWTVKLPLESHGAVGLLARAEHVFPAGPDPAAGRPPAEALDLVRVYVRGRPVVPVARLSTLRRTVELADELGRPALVVTDDEVSVMHGRRIASRFREVEVELAPGVSDEALSAVVERLLGSGAGPVDNAPKLRRALGPRADAPPELQVGQPEEAATVSEVVRGPWRPGHRGFRHDAGVRLVDPEDAHQARVATRRLRSDLRTFRGVLEPGWPEPLREELRWLGGELGAVRDAEVLRDRLSGREALLEPGDRPAAEEILGRLEGRRAAAREHLLVSIREPRFDTLADALVGAASERGAGRGASARGPPSVLEGRKHLRGAIDGIVEDPSDEALHAARIRAKRVRYAAEALAPVFGKRARSFAEAAAGLQDVLGEHQDAVVAGAWLREAVAAGADGFVAGQLASLEARAAREAREAWPAAWKALSRKRLRFWA